jgi:hypothetical protein
VLRTTHFFERPVARLADDLQKFSAQSVLLASGAQTRITRDHEAGTNRSDVWRARAAPNTSTKIGRKSSPQGRRPARGLRARRAAIDLALQSP